MNPGVFTIESRLNKTNLLVPNICWKESLPTRHVSEEDGWQCYWDMTCAIWCRAKATERWRQGFSSHSQLSFSVHPPPWSCFKPSSNSVLRYTFSTFHHNRKRIPMIHLWIMIADYEIADILFSSNVIFFDFSRKCVTICKCQREQSHMRPWLTDGKPLGSVRLSYSKACIHTNNMTTCACLCCRGHSPLTFIFERCTLDRRCCLFPLAVKRWPTEGVYVSASTSPRKSFFPNLLLGLVREVWKWSAHVQEFLPAWLSNCSINI